MLFFLFDDWEVLDFVNVSVGLGGIVQGLYMNGPAELWHRCWNLSCWWFSHVMSGFEIKLICWASGKSDTHKSMHFAFFAYLITWTQTCLLIHGVVTNGFLEKNVARKYWSLNHFKMSPFRFIDVVDVFFRVPRSFWDIMGYLSKFATSIWGRQKQ